MNKTPPIWKFKKENGKWESELNIDFLFYMETAKGFPHDMAIDKINELTPRQRLESKLDSWKRFVKEKNIDIKPIQEENLKHKEEYKEALKEIYNL